MSKLFFEKIVPKVEKIDNTKELPPIPHESVDGWKKIPVKECGEKLVPVGAFSEFPNCDTSAVYFGERGKGKEMNFLGQEVNRDVSLITHFVRKEVLKKLKIAQSLMPEDYYFRFFDNFRPLEVQQALYDAQKNKFKKEHSEWDEVQLEEKTQKYVSLPSPNKELGTTHSSPHSTGGVVDLTIIKLNNEGMRLLKELEQKMLSGKLNYPIEDAEKKNLQAVEEWIENEAKEKGWNEKHKKYVRDNWLSNYRYAREKARIFKNQATSLNMGTDFDHFGPEAGTRYFEDFAEQRKLSKAEKEALQNRRFLYQVMKRAGFSNYSEEWWHWSFGDNMDAANCKKESAIYGGAKMSEENLAFEKARRGQYFDYLDRIGKRGLFVDSIEVDNQYFKENL